MVLFRRRRHPEFPCPFCGAAVRAGAAACRACGSDVDTGWAETAESFAGDPGTGYAADDDFDYEAWLREELGDAPAPARIRRALPRLLLVLALVAFLLAVLWPR
jgi:hypothetical protein